MDPSCACSEITGHTVNVIIFSPGENQVLVVWWLRIEMWMLWQKQALRAGTASIFVDSHITSHQPARQSPGTRSCLVCSLTVITQQLYAADPVYTPITVWFCNVTGSRHSEVQMNWEWTELWRLLLDIYIRCSSAFLLMNLCRTVKDHIGSIFQTMIFPRIYLVCLILIIFKNCPVRLFCIIPMVTKPIISPVTGWGVGTFEHQVFPRSPWRGGSLPPPVSSASQVSSPSKPTFTELFS